MKKYFGMSDAELSRRLKITKHAVGKWRKRGRVPAERVLAVERETGISRHDLRPDLYPRDPPGPPQQPPPSAMVPPEVAHGHRLGPMD
ncbi:MAG: helix-turn-helix domain-containing protein [Gammaproteobacteria bacterium]|nr:helix-turn-helix domain-containing protein [Gammaproteobacteria bacterium]